MAIVGGPEPHGGAIIPEVGNGRREQRWSPQDSFLTAVVGAPVRRSREGHVGRGHPCGGLGRQWIFSPLSCLS